MKQFLFYFSCPHSPKDETLYSKGEAAVKTIRVRQTSALHKKMEKTANALAQKWRDKGVDLTPGIGQTSIFCSSGDKSCHKKLLEAGE